MLSSKTICVQRKRLSESSIVCLSTARSPPPNLDDATASMWVNLTPVFLLLGAKILALTLVDERVNVNRANASQSTTYRGDYVDYEAGRAVDESPERCSRTLETPPRWWRLQLEPNTPVTRVRVHLDADMNATDVSVTLSDETSPENRHSCTLNRVEIDSWEKWAEFLCSSLESQFSKSDDVTIRDLRQRPSKLAVCEVEVYKYNPQPTTEEEQGIMGDEGNSSEIEVDKKSAEMTEAVNISAIPAAVSAQEDTYAFSTASGLKMFSFLTIIGTLCWFF